MHFVYLWAISSYDAKCMLQDELQQMSYAYLVGLKVGLKTTAGFCLYSRGTCVCVHVFIPVGAPLDLADPPRMSMSSYLLAHHLTSLTPPDVHVFIPVGAPLDLADPGMIVGDEPDPLTAFEQSLKGRTVEKGWLGLYRVHTNMRDLSSIEKYWFRNNPTNELRFNSTGGFESTPVTSSDISAFAHSSIVECFLGS